MAKKPTQMQTLRKDLMVSRAHDILRLATSHKDIAKLTTDRYMASGLIISIRNLSGNTVIEDTLIADGLSPETIAAIQADIKRTHDLRLAFAKIA